MKKLVSISLLVIALLAHASIGGVFYPDGATTLHFAFEGSPNPDRPIIRPPAFYRAEDGFGFVDSPALLGTSRGCTAASYFRFDVNLPEGNYDVIVISGGTAADSVTTIKAESHRPMLLDLKAAPRAQGTGSFTINVRHGSAGDTSMNLDGRINLEFVGTNPSMMKLDIKPNETAKTVYLIGGSTMADHEDLPTAGWGQMLPILFKPGAVAIANHAVAGATAQSFIEQKRLDVIARKLKPGDYLFVQFPTSNATSLQPFLEEAKTHQATMVLVTPVASGPNLDADANVSVAMQGYALKFGVAAINLNTKSRQAFVRLGEEPFKADDANFTPYGAFEIAKFVAQEIKQQNLDLASQLVEEIGSNNDPSAFPASLGYDLHLKK